MSEQKSTSVHKAPSAAQIENFVRFSKHLAQVHHTIGDSYDAFAEVAPRIIASAVQIGQQVNPDMGDAVQKAIKQIADNYQIVAEKMQGHMPVVAQHIYDLSVALQITGLERGTLYNKAWMGTLPAIKVDRRLHFSQETLTALVLESQTPAMKSIAEIGRIARQAHELGIDLNQFIQPESPELATAA